MRKPVVTVFGGSGFVGRHVVRALAQRGYRIRVAVRKPHKATFLQTFGGLGQIQLFQANIRDDASCAAALRGADMCVNLVGILFQSGKQKFRSVQADGAARVAKAAREAGVTRFVQVSAIGADASSRSVYGQTKAQGEKAVLEHMPEATVLRPSIVFGPEDDFFNQFASLARIAPALPLVGGGKTRFQPVFAGDVADAVAIALEDRSTDGRIYELGGPQVLTFRQCLELMLEEIGRRDTLFPALVPLPFWLAGLMAQVLRFMPKPLLTPDQVRLLRTDNVVGATGNKEIGTIHDLGIEPTAVEVILPLYMVKYRKAGQFTTTLGS